MNEVDRCYIMISDALEAVRRLDRKPWKILVPEWFPATIKYCQFVEDKDHEQFEIVIMKEDGYRVPEDCMVFPFNDGLAVLAKA